MHQVPRRIVFLFDIGGVIIDWNNNDPIYRYIGNRYGIKSAVIKRVFTKNLRMLETGNISLHKFVTTCLAEVGLSLNKDYSAHELMVGPFARIAKPRNDVLRLIRLLRRKGFPVYALTNTSFQHLEVMRQKGWLRYFEKTFASCKIGYMKPEEEIFRIVLHRMKVSPNRVIFVDDNDNNVRAARRIGIVSSILFRTGKDLERRITKILEESSLQK